MDSLSRLNHSMADMLATNRTLLEVRWRSTFCELRTQCFPDAPAFIEKDASGNKGYYLMDAPVGSGLQEPLRLESLARIAPEILKQELAEAGIPTANWPDVESFDIFNEYLHVNYLALIADLGTEPLRNITV